MQRGMLTPVAEDLAASLKMPTTTLCRSSVGSAFVAEALAVKACLKAARSLDLSKLIIWSDSKSLVMAISNKEKITETQRVLFDISQLCSTFISLFFFLSCIKVKQRGSRCFS